MPPHREHSERIKLLLTKLDADRAALLNLYHKELCYEGATIFPLDIVANGAVKRAISANSGFKMMIESRNLVVARTLLRTHIDTALRFSAAWLVDTQTQDHPWLPKVYSELSGYVHFSGAHVSASVSAIGKDDGLVSFKISEIDEGFPEFS